MGTRTREKMGTNSFQASWLANPDYKDWLRRKSSTHATCTLCLTDFSIQNMGEAAIKSHAKVNPPEKKSTKHQKLRAEQIKARGSLSVLHYLNCQNAETSTSTSVNALPTNTESVTDVSSPSLLQSSLEYLVIPLSIIHAEIRWTMKLVLSNLSFRSCLGLKELFQSMFYDSDIAKGFKLSKTKCSYYVNYGLAHFYKKKLIAEVNASPFFTLHFDESMNKVLQTEQMDGCVRFWSDECNQVKTHYLDSQFFNHPNSTNIVQGIESTIKPLHKQKMTGLGMDGPTTNWAVLKLIQEDRKELEFPLVENIGSCGLHVVPGALQTVVTESSWPLKKVLKAMWQVLHDSPARKDVFVKINQSEKFAL